MVPQTLRGQISKSGGICYEPACRRLWLWPSDCSYRAAGQLPILLVSVYLRLAFHSERRGSGAGSGTTGRRTVCGCGLGSRSPRWARSDALLRRVCRDSVRERFQFSFSTFFHCRQTDPHLGDVLVPARGRLARAKDSNRCTPVCRLNTTVGRSVSRSDHSARKPAQAKSGNVIASPRRARATAATFSPPTPPAQIPAGPAQRTFHRPQKSWVRRTRRASRLLRWWPRAGLSLRGR